MSDDIKRFNVNFSPETYQVLTDEARRTGKSLSQVLRDALTLDHHVREERRNGSRLMLERDGTSRELVLL